MKYSNFVMNKRQRRSLLLLLASTVLVSSGASVFAQTAAPAKQAPADTNTVTLDDIVVTARKVSERAQDIPISMTAVTASVLAQQNINSVASLEKFTPSLKMSSITDGPSSPSVALRGQITSDTLLSADQPIGLYRDGVYIARQSGAFGRLVDIERVEVLKGPQGTLYGRNTTGGAIVLYSVQPKIDEPVGGYVAARYGSQQSREIEGAINVPLGANAAMRISGIHANNDGFATSIQPNDTSNDIDQERTNSLRAIVQYNPRDDLRINIAADWANIKSRGMAARLTKFQPLDQLSDGAAGVLLNVALETRLAQGVDPETAAAEVFGPFDPAFTDPSSPLYDPFSGFAVLDGARTDLLNAGAAFGKSQTGGTATALDGRNYAFADIKFWGVGATIEYDIGEVTLKSITAFRKTKSDTFNDLDGTAFNILQTETLLDQKQFSQELQATGRAIDGKLSWLVGAFYFKESGTDTAVTQNLGTLALFNPRVATPYTAIGDSTNSSISGFGQATYNFTDKLSVTGGLRYTRDRKRMDLINVRKLDNFRDKASNFAECLLPGQGPLGNGLLPQFPQSLLIRDATGAPVGGECLAKFNNVFSSLSYTAGVDYKPADNILVYAKTGRGFRSGGHNFRGRAIGAAYQPYEPETLTDYEIGIKSDLFGKRLRLNMSGYISSYNNLQRSVAAFVPETQSTTYSLANAGKAKISGVELEATAVVTDGLKIGGSFGYVKMKYKTFIDKRGVDRSAERFLNIPTYSYSLYTNLDVPVGDTARFNLNVDWAWQSDTAYDATPTSVEPSYGLLGARASLSVETVPISISVSATNLLKKEYFSQPPLDGSLGYVLQFSGRPRTVMAEIKYNF
jgi:iron complex outermembrane recepter protein